MVEEDLRKAVNCLGQVARSNFLLVMGLSHAKYEIAFSFSLPLKLSLSLSLIFLICPKDSNVQVENGAGFES